jgi:predicted nuclease of predicted toxin-antitoxin system
VLIMVDECLPMDFVAELRARGHDVTWARESHRMASDEELLRIAQSQNRIILTEDRDFGRLTIRNKMPAIGIVMIRVGDLPGTIAQIAAFVADSIDRLGDTCIGAYTVIGPDRTRRRGL